MFPRISAVPPDEARGCERALRDIADEISAVHLDADFAIVVAGESSAAAAVRAASASAGGAPIEVHLRGGGALAHLPSLAAAGAALVIVDDQPELAAIISEGHRLGLRVGVMSPIAVPGAVEKLAPHVAVLDVVLVGAAAADGFNKRAVSRVALVRELFADHRRDVEIQIEGGIDETTAALAVTAGADTLVVGRAVFESARPPRRAVRELRAAAQGLGSKAHDDAAERLALLHTVERSG